MQMGKGHARIERFEYQMNSVCLIFYVSNIVRFAIKKTPRFAAFIWSISSCRYRGVIKYIYISYFPVLFHICYYFY